MKVHEVKTLPRYWQDGYDGRKPFEVRRNDRDYKEGDILRQLEWNPETGYTGRSYDREITFILDDPEYCKDGFVVLGLGTHVLDTRGRCGSCKSFFPVGRGCDGVCLKQRYGKDVVCDQTLPYRHISRSRKCCPKYEEAEK